MFTVLEIESTEHWPGGRKRRKGNCEKKGGKNLPSTHTTKSTI
jgi:hypothetical protein